MMQLVEALCHKTRSCAFDSWLGLWKYSSDLFILFAFAIRRVHSACHRNEKSAECQSKDGSPTFNLPSESPWLVTGKL